MASDLLEGGLCVDVNSTQKVNPFINRLVSQFFGFWIEGLSLGPKQAINANTLLGVSLSLNSPMHETTYEIYLLCF